MDSLDDTNSLLRVTYGDWTIYEIDDTCWMARNRGFIFQSKTQEDIWNQIDCIDDYLLKEVSK